MRAEVQQVVMTGDSSARKSGRSIPVATAMTEPALLVISPVRNEAEHIAQVAHGIANQTRQPSLWLVVDDGSEDDTPEILRRLAAELPFMRVVSPPPDLTNSETTDRLAIAAEARAFNYGLSTIDPETRRGFTHIGKLDGDIELRPDYYEGVLAEFARNPRLGLAGGRILELHGREWRAMAAATEHVRGALKLYTAECFDAIGGIRERLGWDGIDGALARMHGFETRSFDSIEALHRRHTGSAGGRLRGHARAGEVHWILNHGAAWTTLRAGKVARLEPRVASGAAFLYGYARAAARRVPRVEIDGYRSFVRSEQRQRMVDYLRRGGRSRSFA